MIGQQQKDQAEKWFKDLRDKICEEFEILEVDHFKLAPNSNIAAKKFASGRKSGFYSRYIMLKKLFEEPSLKNIKLFF